MDDFRGPNRRPWLILIVVAAVVVLFLYRKFTGEKEDAPRQTMETRVAESPPPSAVGMSAPAPVTRDTGSSIAPAAASSLMSEAIALEAQHPGNPSALVQARAKYLELLRQSPDARTRTKVEERLGRINVTLVSTPMSMPGKTEYVVKRGDSIEVIARRYGTTVQLIQKGNDIKNPNLIKVGDHFRILDKPKLHVVVSKSRNDMVLTVNGEFFKRYRVGTGKYGKTPEGTFVICDRIPEPVWWKPDGKEVPFGDPENILGTRWMALKASGETPQVRGYGIHGTWAPESVGKALSAGCIRMINADVEELFDILPLGTPVTIEE